MLGRWKLSEAVRNLVTDATILRLEHRILKQKRALLSSQIQNAAKPPRIPGAKSCPVCHGTGGHDNSLCTTCKGMGRL